MLFIRRFVAVFFVFSALAFSACGGGGDLPNITEPTLDLNEATLLAVDQFYVSSFPNDEYNSPKFAVYLKDANNDTVIACAGDTDGLDAARESRVYYGNLNIPFQSIENLESYEAFSMQLVVVEKDSDPCPATISGDDEIIGVSEPLTVENLLNKQITTTNGLASVMLKIQGTLTHPVPKMVATLSDQIQLADLKFVSSTNDKNVKYYLYIDAVDDPQGDRSCLVGAAVMPLMTSADVIYGALGRTFDCKDGKTMTIDRFQGDVVAHLWRQGDGSAEQVASTTSFKVQDFIGEQVQFSDGQGYFSIRDISTTPFSRVTASTEELQLLLLNNLLFKQDIAGTPSVEVHVLDGVTGYSIVCSGRYQGMEAVVVSHTDYSGLNATFIPVTDIYDLFGWETVKIAVVNRTPANQCPDGIIDEDIVLGETAAVGVGAIIDRELTLLDTEGNNMGFVRMGIVN